MMNTVDIIFCSLPVLFLDRAPGAPALLKATAQEAGFSAVGIDLNIEFFINQAGRNIEKFNRLSAVFEPHGVPDSEALQSAKQWVLDSIQLIQKYNPKIVGLSVFTVFQHRATLLLATALRKELPNTKIIMGGYGLNIVANGLKESNIIKRIDLLKPLHQLVQEKNLADKIFIGSALEDLVDYLQAEFPLPDRKSNFKIKYQKEKTVLYNSPIPDYDDYKFNEYVWTDGTSLPVTGSRGCVRKCTFCDIPGQFGKFSFREGTDIAEEIIELSTKYNIRTFEFTDSLVNGSLKSFKQWLTVLANYNDTALPDKKIRWFGQYICRPKNETPSEIYDLLVRSGVRNLVIGMESGSNAVLDAMDKKMRVEDAYHEFDQFNKYRIQTNVLMLSSFYNETWERFVETLEFIVRLQYYVASGVVTGVNMGPPLYINKNMPLYQFADTLGIIVDPYSNHNWTVASDPTNTLAERSYRRMIAQLVLDKLGIPANGATILNLHQVKSRLEQVKQELINAQS